MLAFDAKQSKNGSLGVAQGSDKPPFSDGRVTSVAAPTELFRLCNKLKPHLDTTCFELCLI